MKLISPLGASVRLPRLSLPHLPALAGVERDLAQRLREARRWLARHGRIAWDRLVAWAIAFPGESTLPHPAATVLLIGSCVTALAGAFYLTTVHPASARFTEQWALGFAFAICAWIQCLAAGFALMGRRPRGAQVRDRR